MKGGVRRAEGTKTGFYQINEFPPMSHEAKIKNKQYEIIGKEFGIKKKIL